MFKHSQQVYDYWKHKRETEEEEEEIEIEIERTNSTVNMAGMREVVRMCDIPLDPKVEFCVALPRRFVDEEPDGDRILETWELFGKVANNLYRTRRSFFTNKHLRRIGFHMGMEKICSDFSRRTENIKIEFHHRKSAKPPRKTRYWLRIVKLSDIVQDVRNARQYCMAEIPIREHEAQAHLVGDAPSSSSASQQQVLEEQGNTNNANLPPTVVPVEIIEDSRDHAGVRGRPHDTTMLLDDEPQDYYANAPIASEVVAIHADDNGHDNESISFSSTNQQRQAGRETKTALQRMQELESIRMFLTAEEYSTKRLAILDSI